MFGEKRQAIMFRGITPDQEGHMGWLAVKQIRAQQLALITVNQSS